MSVHVDKRQTKQHRIKGMSSVECVPHDKGSDRLETTTAPVTVTKATYLFVLCASLNSCNLGFDIGVSTEAGRLIQNDMGLTRT